MKLPVLSTRIHTGGQVLEERAVVFTPREGRGQRAGVHARDPGLEPRRDHLLGQLSRRAAPEREDRPDARRREPLLAIAADVLQEQVAEGHGRDALGAGLGTLAAALLALLIGLFSLRVRAIFFAMVTLAVASAFELLVSQDPSASGASPIVAIDWGSDEERSSTPCAQGGRPLRIVAIAGRVQELCARPSRKSQALAAKRSISGEVGRP